MLKVDFDVQVTRDAKEIIITDKTSGWDDDLGIEDVYAVVFTYVSPGGVATKINTRFLPSDGQISIPANYLDSRYVHEISTPPVYGSPCCDIPPISVFASVFQLNPDNIPVGFCSEGEDRSWPDGCHTWRYELFVKDALMSYNLKLRIPQEDQLFLRVSDSWVNYTDQTSYNEGYRYFFVTDTDLVIDKYEVRSGMEVVTCGAVNPFNVKKGGPESAYLALAGYAEFKVPIHVNLSNKITEMSIPILTSERVGDLCHTDLDVFASQVYRYQAVISDPGCSCEDVAHHIEAIGHILDEMKGGGSC